MSNDRIESLERLVRLRDSGALSNEEYEAEKLNVLGAAPSPILAIEHPLPRTSRAKWPILAGIALAATAGAAVLGYSSIGALPNDAADGGAERSDPATKPGPMVEPDATETAEAAAQPIEPSEPDLSRYADKYPFDEIGGVKFLDHPQVLSLVQATVADAPVAARVLDDNVTAGPISVNAESVLYWGCEPHNCGPHNWTILIGRTTNTAEVCYYNEQTGDSLWYRSSGRIDVADSCPQEL